MNTWIDAFHPEKIAAKQFWKHKLVVLFFEQGTDSIKYIFNNDNELQITFIQQLPQV